MPNCKTWSGTAPAAHIGDLQLWFAGTVAVPGGMVRKLAIHGLPLGLFPEVEYEVTRIQCQPGDTLLFYTDGVVDAVDSDGKEFGTERLCEIVAEARPSKTFEIVSRVFEEVSAHCRCEMNSDDQTVVAIRVL